METYVTKIRDLCLLYGANVIAACIIFIVGRWLAGIVSSLTETLMHRAKVEKTLATFIKNLTYSTIIVLASIAAINKLGVETTSLIAMLGAAGLAIGLALQGSLANFAAGILLVILKPFKIGDMVEIAGITGTIEEIEIFNTTLTTPDNRTVIIPNNKITSDNIINLSAPGKRRIDLVFGISYGDDMKKAKQALEAVVKADPRILKDPAPTIAVSELADSSVNLVCRPWVKPADYWDVYFSVVEQGKTALESSGITIPFPQSDVHMYQEKK